MTNYQDFSEILEQQNFSEQSLPQKQPKHSLVDQLVQSKLDSMVGDIFKKTGQNQESPEDQKNRLEFDYQEFFPNHKTDNSLEPPVQASSESQSSLPQTFDPDQNPKKKKKRKENDQIKNIIGNVTRKSMDIMLNNSKHIAYVKRECKKIQINYKEFETYFKGILKKIYGPKSIIKLFEINEDDPIETKMKEMFEKVFIDIVRKRYPIYLLKLGKMNNTNLYFQIKNKKLLYFPDQTQNVMKKSYV